jgi:hypothetical protein
VRLLLVFESARLVAGVMAGVVDSFQSDGFHSGRNARFNTSYLLKQGDHTEIEQVANTSNSNKSTKESHQ